MLSLHDALPILSAAIRSRPVSEHFGGLEQDRDDRIVRFGVGDGCTQGLSVAAVATLADGDHAGLRTSDRGLVARRVAASRIHGSGVRSEEHTSELQSLMRIS